MQNRFAHITALAFLVLFVLIPIADLAVLFAQPPPPTLPGMPDQAPIDGGLGLLAAAGGAYAWKKLKGRTKN